MKKKLTAVCLLAVLLCSLAFTYQATLPSWEYKIISLKLDPKAEAKINEFGAQGWELIEYSEFQSGGTTVDAGAFIFKRPTK